MIESSQNSQFVRLAVDHGVLWEDGPGNNQDALKLFAEGRFREAVIAYSPSDSEQAGRVLIAPFASPAEVGKMLWSRPSMEIPVKKAFADCFMELEPQFVLQSELSFLIELDDVILTPNHLIITREGRLLRQGVSHLIPTPAQKFHSQVYPEIKFSGPTHVLMELPETARVVDTPCIFLTAGDTLDCGKSYYHWMIDYLTRMVIYQRFPQLNPHPMICYGRLLPYQRRSLELIGVPEHRLLHKDPGESLFCRKLYVASSASYPAVVYPEAVEFLRTNLQSRVAPVAGPDRIYITRRKNPRRNIVNEEAIEKYVRQKGFAVIDPGELDFDREIAFFADALIIAGPSGAGLVNAAFARPGATMIDIMTDPDVNHFSTMAAAAGLNYHNLLSTPIESRENGASAERQYFLPIEKLKALIRYLELMCMKSRSSTNN